MHGAELERFRAQVAPIGTFWRSHATGQVWQLVEREGNGVLLQLPGTKRHKSGLLHNLLRGYRQCFPS